MQNLNGSDGSVTIIGRCPRREAILEPVTQNTKRFVRCFLALDKSLAYARHYPAINWLTSYSEYIPDLTAWYETNVGPTFVQCRNEILNLLTMENRLNEIVKLIGSDVLPDDQKLVLEIARVIRLGFCSRMHSTKRTPMCRWKTASHDGDHPSSLRPLQGTDRPEHADGASSGK